MVGGRTRTASPLKAILCVLSVVLILGGAAAAAIFVPRQAALLCLLQTTQPVPELGTLPHGIELVEGDRALGFERALIARPPGASTRRPVIVLVPGIIDEHGVKNPRVVQAADAFRKAGHVVFVPEVIMFADSGRDSDDLSTLVGAVQQVAKGEIQGTRPQAFGMVGISLGGALALRAAAKFRRQGGRGCRAILTIGAPGNLRTEAQAWFERPLPAEDMPPGAQRESLLAAAFARNVLYRAALPTLIAHDRDHQTLKTWLDKQWMPNWRPTALTWTSNAWLPAMSKIELHTAAAREFVASFLGGVERWTRDRKRTLNASWGRMRHSSPAHWGQHFRDLEGVAIFLLHGIHDPLISINSLAQLKMFMSRATLTTALRSELIGHAEVVDVGIGEQLRHVAFLDDFFDMVGG